jgi:hypothetical protein
MAINDDEDIHFQRLRYRTAKALNESSVGDSALALEI